MGTRKRLRVALVGAGGVGKSTLLSEFRKDGFAVFPSITREFYQLMGMSDQNTYMQLSNTDKANFQRKMRNFYQAKYSSFISEHPDMDTVTDRSIFDHMAYGIYGIHDQFSIQKIRQLVDTCIAYANSGVYTNLIYLPYPQPWQSEQTGADTFRKVEPAQDYSVANIMLGTIFQAKVVERRLKPGFSPMYGDFRPAEAYQQILKVLEDTRDEMDVGRERVTYNG